MPPKGATRAPARRGRAKAVRGGKAAALAAEVEDTTTPKEEPVGAEDHEDQSAAGPSSSQAAAPLVSTPQLSEDSFSPNSSPATVPTETPAPTPARPAHTPILPRTAPPSTQPSVRGGPSTRGGRGGARGGPKAPSKFKPKAVRSDASKRAELAQKEQERLASLAASAAKAEARANRGRGRPARGRGDVMGRPATSRGSGGGSGIFGALPESIKRAPNGFSTPRSGGGASSGGFGVDLKKEPGSRSGGGGGGGGSGGGGGHYSSGDYPNPRYPGQDDDTPRVDIELINLVSDDEDSPRSSHGRRGMLPVRLDRHEHQPRITMVNTGPAVKAQPDDGDKIEIDEKRSARPAIKQDSTKGDPGDEIQIKSEPDLNVTFRGTTPDPSAEVEPISPNSRRKVKARHLSPGMEVGHDTSINTLPEYKDEKKARRSSKKRDQKSVLQTEEDRAEYARHLLDVEVLAKELGGMQGNLNSNSKGKDAEGDNLMDDAAKPEDHRSGRLYLFQFPPVLPELYNPVEAEKPKDNDADVPMTGTEPSPKGKGKLKDRTDLIGEATTIKVEEEAVPLDKVKKEEVKKGRTPYVNEEGWIGKLIVRKSGRVELSWGGVNLLVGRGVDAGFLTTGIVVDSLEKGPPGGGTPEGRALSMGQIMGNTMSESIHLIIIGAGLAGLSAGVSTKIANPNHRVTILESVKELAEIGAGLQLTPNATRLFKPWGIYEQLAPKATFPKALSVHRYDGTKVLAHEPNFQEQIDERYGSPFWGMHRVDLQRAMAARCKELGITIRLNAKVISVDFEMVEVKLQDGEIIDGDVVLCADGLWSSTRSQFLGKPSPAILTGDLAYRIVINTADLTGPDAPELQKFIRDSTVNFWVGPGTHVDGAVIGSLLGKVNGSGEGKAEQLKECAKLYQALRKERGEGIQRETFKQRRDFHLPDGKEQEERDELMLSLLGEELKADFPSRWTCPRVQRWLYGYDAYKEVEEAFAKEPF
ncbi:putative 3-hydroxybenzoate 6-hydroxylase 1 [Cadophora sp. MPI-SDFR-AT-0126]|nr:putative 3-hydroxybenzoate 6-hydroxylase 1 [Leotiomycetes sp. MPI-SDFR-AT-0126]